MKKIILNIALLVFFISFSAVEACSPPIDWDPQPGDGFSKNTTFAGTVTEVNTDMDDYEMEIKFRVDVIFNGDIPITGVTVITSLGSSLCGYETGEFGEGDIWLIHSNDNGDTLNINHFSGSQKFDSYDELFAYSNAHTPILGCGGMTGTSCFIFNRFENISVFEPNTEGIYKDNENLVINWWDGTDAGNKDIYLIDSHNKEVLTKNNVFVRSSGIDGTFSYEIDKVELLAGEYSVKICKAGTDECGFSNSFVVSEGQKDLIACTEDAMQCPDGSWIGRTGPNCEFVCPKATEETVNNVSDDEEYEDELDLPEELEVGTKEEPKEKNIFSRFWNWVANLF